MEDDFKERKVALITLSETKMKENGKISKSGVNGVCVEVQESERAI